MTRFTAGGDVGVTVLFEPEEARALRDLGAYLQPLLDGGVPNHGDGDPIRSRLFPRAYVDPTEDLAEEEFQSYVHDDLVESKAAALRVLIADLEGRAPDRKGRVAITLDPAGMDAWVSAINDVRLAMGVTLGVTEDMDPLDDAGVDSAGGIITFATYDWLTHVQGALVDVLLGRIEES